MNNAIYKGKNRTCPPDPRTIGDRCVWGEGESGRQGCWGPRRWQLRGFSYTDLQARLREERDHALAKCRRRDLAAVVRPT